MKKTILMIFVCLIFSSLAYAQGTTDTNTETTKTTTETKKKRVIFRATKDQVTQVQTMLKEKGTYEGDADGKFNKDFRKAIKGFQGENGLKKTGTLNRATLEKMGVELTEKQKAIPVNPNSYAGAEEKKEKKPRKKAFRPTKTQIKEAQTKLKDAGKFEGEVTGKYSKDFRAVLKAYQEENELKKTGKLDETTLNKMGIELTDKQKGIEVVSKTSDKPRRKSFRVNKDQIMQAQKLLKEKELFDGEETGKYSKDFRAAIRDYQSANGLKRKGSLNRATLEKMGIELTDKQKEIPVNPNDIATPKDPNKPKRKIFRATKDQIMQVQKMLKEKGLYNGEETGKLNPATRSAIREWQAQNNVKKTGTLNKATLEAMRIELTDKQKDF